MLFDFLSESEAEFTKHALDELASVEWAKPVIQRVREGGGLVKGNMPILFEARFAYELHRYGGTAQYEFAAGMGNSKIDFSIEGSPKWLVELVSIRESAAAAAAKHGDDKAYIQVLSTPRADATRDEVKQSTEGEMLLLEQKIGEKVFSNSEPTKFPEPKNSYHMIVVDTRGYLNGGDQDDFRQVSFGPHGVKMPEFILKWHNPRTNRPEPIKGLFENDNPLPASRLIRERIHFLAFVCEKKYADDEIPTSLRYFANPHLVAGDGSCKKMLATFPLFRKS